MGRLRLDLPKRPGNAYQVSLRCRVAMERISVPLERSEGAGYVIPLGGINLVAVVAVHGLVGCGAIDVAALQTFGYPAARVRPGQGTSVATVPSGRRTNPPGGSV